MSKIWGFDQSKRAQGPIFIIKVYNNNTLFRMKQS